MRPRYIYFRAVNDENAPIDRFDTRSTRCAPGIVAQIDEAERRGIVYDMLLAVDDVIEREDESWRASYLGEWEFVDECSHEGGARVVTYEIPATASDVGESHPRLEFARSILTEVAPSLLHSPIDSHGIDGDERCGTPLRRGGAHSGIDGGRRCGRALVATACHSLSALRHGLALDSAPRRG